MRLATEQFLFPPQVSVLEDPAFIEQESEFYGGQKVNALFAEISTTVDTDFQWLPFMDYVYSTYEETIGTVDRRQGRHRRRPRRLAGPARQLRRGPGLHRRVSREATAPRRALRSARAARTPHPTTERSHRVARHTASAPTAHDEGRRHRPRAVPVRPSASSTSPPTSSSLPFFVVFVTMLVVPLVYSGYLSLFESKLIGGDGRSSGLDNYGRALTDPQFLGEPRPRRAVLRHPGADHAGRSRCSSRSPLDTVRARGSQGHPAADLHAVRRARRRRHPHVGLPLRPRLRPDRPDRATVGLPARRLPRRPRTSSAR